MALKYQYTLSMSGSTMFELYGIIQSIPAPLKKNGIIIEGSMQMGTNSTKSGWKTTSTCTMRMKIGTNQDEVIAYKTNTSATGGTSMAQATFSVTVDLRTASKLGFCFIGTGTKSGGSGSFLPNFAGSAEINITFPSDIATETSITAAKVNEIAEVLGSSASASAGSDIVKSPYATLATAAGSTAFDSTSPKASDLTALINKVNSTVLSRTWDSTSQSDY